MIKQKLTFTTFFSQASLHPNGHLITGLIWGYRVEGIENPTTRQARYLDTQVDGLVNGLKVEQILRE